MNSQNSAGSLISIQVGDETSRRYKSIQSVTWNDIPPFAVLTGPNGAGKTQLMQILAYQLSKTPNDHRQPINQVPLRITGGNIEPDEIAYLPSTEYVFRVQGSSIGGLQEQKKKFLEQLAPENTANNLDATILRSRVERQFGIKIRSGAQVNELALKLPDDFLYMLNYSDVSSSLSHVFLGYQVRFAQKLLDGKSKDDVKKEIGKPPWELVNDALQAAEFSYRVTEPDNNLLQHYQVQIKTLDGNTKMALNDLSSGEKAILRTLLWFYNSKHNNIYPKLFLLDEPDAHLHPSMTRQFIDVLKTVLVDQYKVRVILTTHSPSTVALAPEDSIFIMARGQSHIGRPQSKAEAIGLLTSGLVFVSAGTKFVLVEDEADVKFYGAVRDVLTDQGPSRDSAALKPAPSLVFLPASTGKRASKIGGGRDVVKQWVEKFDTEPLNEMIRGIIDLDSGNAGTPRVQVTSRYTLENYQLDPFVVFGLLIEEKVAPPLSGISVAVGDEHLIRGLPSATLQLVVDYIASQIEPNLASIMASETAATPVTFTSGLSVNYPSWMLTRSGHELLPIYQRVFGQYLVTPPRLEKSFRRLRLVPVELANIMTQLQKA